MFGLNSFFLPKIRLLEAVSFRSFPATKTVFDGTWAIRMTAGHPAKRLNSINPLDPQDYLDLDNRIALAERRFESFGRPVAFRLTPLAPKQLSEILLQKRWLPHEESIVMELDLANADFAHSLDHVPFKDIGRWVDAYIKLSGLDVGIKPGLAEIIGATEPETGLFVHKQTDGDEVLSLIRCVSDRGYAGIFDLASDPRTRRNGHARIILNAALLWAKRNKAARAWLQVVADNEPALRLYHSIGFQEVYRYSYWKPPSSQ